MRILLSLWVFSVLFCFFILLKWHNTVPFDLEAGKLKDTSKSKVVWGNSVLLVTIKISSQHTLCKLSLVKIQGNLFSQKSSKVLSRFWDSLGRYYMITRLLTLKALVCLWVKEHTRMHTYNTLSTIVKCLLYAPRIFTEAENQNTVTPHHLINASNSVSLMLTNYLWKIALVSNITFKQDRWQRLLESSIEIWPEPMVQTDSLF